MFCPRCGAKNEDGNRYCVNCGSDLPGSPGKPATTGKATTPRELIDRMIGTSPRARLLSAGTALAILVAVIGFIALAPSHDGGEDAFTRQLDQSCVTEKQTIAALERQTAQRSAELGAFAGALVTIVEEWRSSLLQPPPPAAHAEAVQALNSALLNVVIGAGALARVASTGSPKQIAAAAGRIDTASAQVERAIENLGLSRCSDLNVAIAAAGSQ
jgi:hypothetical protein